MLTLAGSFRIGEFSLWRDRQRQGDKWRLTSRFYALRDEPRIASRRRPDGSVEPAFDFLWYRRQPGAEGPQPEAGGLVVLTADLALSETEKDELVEAVAHRFADLGEPLGGEIEILPVPFQEGRVELSFAGERATTADGELIRHLAGSGPARLSGHQSASFLVELNADGAALLAEAIDSGTNLFELRYDLAFAHRLDGVELRVWCDSERAQGVIAEARRAGPLVLPELRQSLTERHLAGTEIVTTEPLDGAHRSALEALATEVLDQALAASFTTSDGDLDGHAAARLNFTLTQSYPVFQPIALQAPLRFDDPRFAPAAFAQTIRRVEAEGGFFDLLEVQVLTTVDFSQEAIDKVKVTLTYDHTAPGGERIHRQSELVLQAGRTSGHFRTDLAAPDRRSISYQVEVHFEGGAPPLHFSEGPLDTTIVVLDLDACGVVAVDAELRDVPFDRVSGAVVDLAYGNPPLASHRLVLDEGRPTGRWRPVLGAALDDDGGLRWKAAWLGRDGRRIEGEWRAAPQGRLLLDAPAELSRRTEIELLAAGDFTDLEQILVDLEPVSDESGTPHQLAFREPGEGKVWRPSAATLDTPFRYRVRQSLVLADGRVETMPTIESDRRLFVVRDAWRREVRVLARLLALGSAWRLALLTLERGIVSSDEAPATADRKTLVLRQPEDRPTWSFRASDPDYSYRLTLVPPTGERLISPWITARDEVLVLKPPQENRG
ncbi:MAG: hypothetical protein AAF604_21385 [Acidobacteriota bacterium]